MDESNPTCNKRFAALGIPLIEAARRAYRGMIVTTPSLPECISSVILYDETIRQQAAGGFSMLEALAEAGILPGIKAGGAGNAIEALEENRAVRARVNRDGKWINPPMR